MVTALRNRHGIVPEALPLFSVEKEDTTHKRKRIMLSGTLEVKFKLFIVGITAKIRAGVKHLAGHGVCAMLTIVPGFAARGSAGRLLQFL